MKNQRYEIIIVGAGLGAFATAARLHELGQKNIAIYSTSYGGTPDIAAINFVLENNPYGDTPKQYMDDMLEAGYGINNKELVEEMCFATVKGYELLKRWGVEFATEADGSLKLRHASGSKYPRSLCSTTQLIGHEIVAKFKKNLENIGIEINLGYECLRVLVEDNQVHGITIKDKNNEIRNVYAPVVVAAWGGVGNLFGVSTYPKDIKGNTIAIAKEAGAELVDMEFLEYEPLVLISPKKAVGEPCPTAMLGEGAYLLNSDMERFILKSRPQGEVGSPKTFLNKEIWKQVEMGKGSQNGGVYVDLRHIPVETLKAYPWFYNRLKNSGVDPTKELIEVGPMAHSFSGGIKIDKNYESTVKGLYAVGEAVGSIHGACRLAGNAGAQAAISGILCAEAISKADIKKIDKEFENKYLENKDVFDKYVPTIRKMATKSLGVRRNGKELQKTYEYLEDLILNSDIKKSTEAYQIALSVWLMVKSALERKESRGTHLRTDYPEVDDTFKRSITV